MKKSTIKNIACWLLITIFLAGCSPQPNSLDRKVFKAYRQCERQSNYVIDFATLPLYDWDTMYYFSGKWDLKDILDTLGVPLNAVSYSDVGPKVFFMREGTRSIKLVGSPTRLNAVPKASISTPQTTNFLWPNPTPSSKWQKKETFTGLRRCFRHTEYSSPAKSRFKN